MSRIRGKILPRNSSCAGSCIGWGYRFRLHVKNLLGKPDIVLPKYKTVIFVYGFRWAEEERGEPELYLCAPDFETFLYRFWLENCICFVLTKKHRSLTQIEANYLHAYQQRRA